MGDSLYCWMGGIMNKHTKHLFSIISVIISLAIINTCCVFANDVQSASIDLDEYVTVINKSGIRLVAEDREDGDSYLYLYENGILMASGFVDRSESIIYETRYGDQKNMSHVYAIANAHYPLYQRYSGYNTRAVVGYNVYDDLGAPDGYRSLEIVGYQSTDYSGSYNLNAVYQDLIHFTGVISLLLGLPGVVSGKIAGYILEALEIALNSTFFRFRTNMLIVLPIELTGMGIK